MDIGAYSHVLYDFFCLFIVKYLIIIIMIKKTKKINKKKTTEFIHLLFIGQFNCAWDTHPLEGLHTSHTPLIGPDSHTKRLPSFYGRTSEHANSTKNVRPIHRADVKVK